MYSIKMEDFERIKQQFTDIWKDMDTKARAKRLRHKKKIDKYQKKYPVFGLVLGQDIPISKNHKYIPSFKDIKEAGGKDLFDNSPNK